MSMTIEGDDFRLSPSLNNASDCWDLELLVTIKGVKGRESRQELKNVGYGLSLESAIRRIINYRIIHKHGEDAITLKTYLEEYKEGIDKLNNLCSAERKTKSPLLD